VNKRFKYGDLVRVTHTYVGQVAQNEEQTWILIDPKTHERLGYFNGEEIDGHTYEILDDPKKEG
jgi:hypothetical protein